jgi:hypothetical protein
MPRIVLTTLGDDPHVLGIFKFSRIARDAGCDVTVLSPGSSYDAIFSEIHEKDPTHIGISYRLSPEIGLREFIDFTHRLEEHGLLRKRDGDYRRLAFAGLPETVEAVREYAKTLPYDVSFFSQTEEPLYQVHRALDYLGVVESRRGPIIQNFARRLYPPRIEELDQMARYVVSSDYNTEPPLPEPSEDAKMSLPKRIMESRPRPVLRTHFGLPSDSIYPTIQGIKRIAETRVIDEISLGSSDLSQRYYGRPWEWKGRKNDGGVPYKDFKDLVELYTATRRGNYPSIKPYAHVYDLTGFVDECIRAGHLIGAHQAVPLFWFNQLDGRGPMTVDESIREHLRAIDELAKRGIPVEINDPNQWASRWGHDSLVVADYGLATAVILNKGVRDFVPQFQFNKPRETGDYGDLAKMYAALDIIERFMPRYAQRPNVWRETRTGIGYFDPDPDTARYQLARSTLLQMMLYPDIIHIVNYCEAEHVALPEDVIESSQLVRRAVRVFQENEPDLKRYLDEPIVRERREQLGKEAETLLYAIAELDRDYQGGDLKDLAKNLSKPHTLIEALRRGYMAAPGIFSQDYPAAGNIVTDVVYGGFIDAIDPLTGHSLYEAQRINEKLTT